MLSKKINGVIDLFKTVGHLFVGTADRNGMPHLAAARNLSLREDGLLEVAEWFCPGTVTNLQDNDNISLVVWNSATDEGYQLLGNLAKIEELSVMDGYAPELETAPVPQVERKIIMRVDKILDFHNAPHSDLVVS